MLKQNLSLLRESGAVELARSIESSMNDYRVDNEAIFIESDLIYSDIFEEQYASVMSQLANPQKVRLARFYHDKDLNNNAYCQAEELIDTRDLSLFASMACNHKRTTDIVTSTARDLLVLGSLAIPCLLDKLEGGYLQENKILSLTVLETSSPRLAASLELYDHNRLIALCKESRIGLHFMLASSAHEAKEELYSFFHNSLPTAIYGLSVIRELHQTEASIEVDSWLFSKSGFSSRLVSNFGFSSDEVNQVIHCYLNTIIGNSHIELKMNNAILGNQVCAIVASGPSIDETYKNIDAGRMSIIATHSSLTTLLSKGIRPDYLVVVERNSVVAELLESVASQNVDISEITLIASYTIDPRVARLFKTVIFFHRPLSTAAALFATNQDCLLPSAGPESVNCALEVAYFLGYRNVILFGADFGSRKREYPRSQNALGESPRNLDLPVAGNFGRTIYSQPSLLLVRDAIEHLHTFLSDLVIYRVGEGLRLDCAKDMSPSDIVMLLQCSSVKSTPNISRFSRVIDVDPREAKTRIKGLVAAIQSKIEQLDCILHCKDWSISTAREIAAYLAICDIDYKSGGDLENAAGRMLRQLVFISLPLLYDSAGSRLKYRILHENYSESLRHVSVILSIIFEGLKNVNLKMLCSADTSWKELLIKSIRTVDSRNEYSTPGAGV